MQMPRLKEQKGHFCTLSSSSAGWGFQIGNINIRLALSSGLAYILLDTAYYPSHIVHKGMFKALAVQFLHVLPLPSRTTIRKDHWI